MAGQWWRGGNRKEKEAGMSTKMAKSTTTGISHSPSPIRVAERGLDLRGKLHFLKRVLSSKGNGRRARGVSKQRTAKQINRNTAARENWRSRRHHHSRRKKKGYGFGTTKKPLTQRNTPPSSTQAAPKQHQQKAPLRRPCSSRARLHSPPNYDNKTQCENKADKAARAHIYITRRRIFWRAKLWAQAGRERGAWMAAGQRTRREGREFQGCHCRCCRRRRRMARGQGASFCARCWAD